MTSRTSAAVTPARKSVGGRLHDPAALRPGPLGRIPFEPEEAPELELLHVDGEPPHLDPGDVGEVVHHGADPERRRPDEVGPARHLVAAPNGDVYVAIQQNRSDATGVYALRDTDGDGKFDQKELFGGAGGTGIALHNGYLYLAHPTVIERYKMTAGQLKPTGPAEVIVTGLPDERLGETVLAWIRLRPG